MSSITLPNIRVSSDLTVSLKLKDGGVAIDWSTLTNIKVSIYSDAQRALAGRCSVSIDEDDNTTLVCTYAANKPQYVGINRVVVTANYLGETKTFDKQAFNFVRWTDDQEGETITIDDPDVDVEIEVEDVSSSILQEAIDAALTAAERAEEAASLVPLQVLQDCVEATEDAEDATLAANNAAAAANAAGITSASATVDNNVGTPAVSVDLTNKHLTLGFTNLKGQTGATGATGATPNLSIGTVTTGAAGSQAAATITGTAEAPVLNLTIPQGVQGAQGNTGSSVDYAYELVNNLTTDDATKGLSAAMGVQLESEVSQLGQDYTNLVKPSLKLRTPENYIFNPTVGYVGKNGVVSTSSSYKWITVANVEEGDIITCWNVGADLTTALVAMRFICAYDANGDAVSAKGVDTTTDTYTVPSGIKKLAISLSATYFTSPWDRQVMIIKGATAPQYFKPGVAPLYEAAGQIIPDQLSNKFKTGFWRFTKASSTDGDSQLMRECHIVKNLVYAFTAKVTSFTQLSIGQESSLHNYFSMCIIDNTKVTFNINGNAYESEHGLTISNYINVRLVENDNTKITLYLESNGQTYTRTIGWYGFGRGGSFRYINTNSVFTDLVFTVSCRDLKDAPVHIHGDSYVAILESTAKWTHWLVADGYGDNTLINAFPGASSGDLMKSLKTILEKGLPRVILWACGMNDGADTDASTPNATWLAKIKDVITICQQNGIEPVLATIPTVPSILHEGKNAWVRNSGYRYVDFAQAVGANSSGVWYSDMLSSDNVHPTEKGAKALYHRVLCDLPDVTFKI